MASETGGTLLARLGTKPELKDLEPHLFQSGPLQGKVYEFYGEEGSGKSQTLQHLVSRCLLPVEWHGYSLGGQGVGVILMDNDYHFSILRLTAIMEKQVMKTVEDHDDTVRNKGEEFIAEIEELLKTCLRNLHVFQCHSLSNMLITLETVQTLCAHDATKCVFFIDSISAMYDSCNQTESRKYFPILIEKLKSLVTVYKLVLLATKTALFQGKDLLSSEKLLSTNYVRHSEYLGKAWSNFVSYRLVFINEDKQIGNFRVIAEHGFVDKFSNRFQICDEGIVFTS